MMSSQANLPSASSNSSSRNADRTPPPTQPRTSLAHTISRSSFNVQALARGVNTGHKTPKTSQHPAVHMPSTSSQKPFKRIEPAVHYSEHDSDLSLPLHGDHDEHDSDKPHSLQHEEHDAALNDPMMSVRYMIGKLDDDRYDYICGAVDDAMAMSCHHTEMSCCSGGVILGSEAN